MLFVVLVSVFPILWVFMSSFKTNAEIMGSPFILPSNVNFDAYRFLFEKYDFATYAFNSLAVSVVPTLLSLLFFSMAAYVIAKYSSGAKTFSTRCLPLRLVPAHARTRRSFYFDHQPQLYNTRMG
jgi:raffinose/stachyose/melibiose transport system permease protein